MATGDASRIVFRSVHADARASSAAGRCSALCIITAAWNQLHACLDIQRQLIPVSPIPYRASTPGLRRLYTKRYTPEPTTRPSDSYRPACMMGPRPQLRQLTATSSTPVDVGCTTTTGTDCTPVSVPSRQSAERQSTEQRTAFTPLDGTGDIIRYAQASYSQACLVWLQSVAHHESSRLQMIAFSYQAR